MKEIRKYPGNARRPPLTVYTILNSVDYATDEKRLHWLYSHHAKYVMTSLY